MKILDRDGRLFGKISIIDVIVILVVAVLALAIYVKGQMPQTGASVTTTPVVYQGLLSGFWDEGSLRPRPFSELIQGYT